jgi:hypothetical protein
LKDSDSLDDDKNMPDVGSGSDYVENQQLSYNDDRHILTQVDFKTIASKVFSVFLS